MIIAKRRGLLWRTTTLFGLLVIVGVGIWISTNQHTASADSLPTGSPITGLWLTGVDGKNNKLGNPDVIDPHWIIDRVYRDDGQKTCQAGYGPDYAFRYIPTGGGSNFQTRTVYSTGTYTGYYLGQKDKYGNYSTWGNLIGNGGPKGSSTIGVWPIVKPNANWISFNFLAHNYSDSSCPDPTRQTNSSNSSNGNIYVFQLKNVNVKDNVDLSSIKMTMQGATDNQVKVFMNNCEMAANSNNALDPNNAPDAGNNWLEPNFNNPSSSFSVKASSTKGGLGCSNADLINGGFHHGDNILSVYVQSTYGMTGLIIWGYTITADTSEYALSPAASMSADTASIGQTVSVNYSVDNVQKRGSSSRATNWAVREVVIPTGTSMPAEFSSYKDDSTGCDYYTSKGGGIRCKELAANDSDSKKVFDANITSAVSDTGQDSLTISGYNPGDRVCRVLVVDSRDQEDTPPPRNRDSALGCVVIAKTPYVQFWGGDVRVGDNIAGAKSNQANALTSSKNINGNTMGSWAEYGIFAPTGGTGGIINSASGGALSGKMGFVGQAPTSALSNLSFANTSTPNGNWAPPATVASYENSLGLPDGGSTSAASISVDAFKGKVTLTNPKGTVRVGGTLPKTSPGRSLMLLYPTGTVVIDRNIILGTDSYGSLADLSQIVIQAKNIVINNNVDRVDAWLVAIAQNGSEGIISTCDVIATPYYYSGLNAKANPCNKTPLRINGPVMGREVQLRRTFGVDGNSTPAETIDLRADAYLWTMQTANTGAIDTIFTTELPPRF